jgi:hypothetical protein
MKHLLPLAQHLAAEESEAPIFKNRALPIAFNTLPEPHLSRSGSRHGCYQYLAACHASLRGDSFHSNPDGIETIPLW